MNQSIRCEPLPFPLVSDKAVAEGAALFPQSSSPDPANPEFGDVLDSEIKDKRATEKERKETEAWTLYGIAPTVIQILQQAIPVSLGATDQSGEVSEGEDLGTNLVPQEAAEPEKFVDPPVGGTAGDSDPGSEKQVQSLVEGLKLAEQKLPSALEDPGRVAEQIAEIPPEPARKASGMVAAQGVMMLSTSQTAEETAPEQKLPLSADAFDALSFEQPIVVKAASAIREPAPKHDFEFTEFSVIDSVTPEWSSFEGLTEANDIQSARPVESIEIAQAIRSHVQLLKSSGQEKLDVVLRPDANTELRLHVEKVNGQILVQARCDRGDFARLDANWNAIQQTLANQGVRVESLQHSASFQNQENRNQSQTAFQHQSHSEQKTEQNFIEQKTAAPKAARPSVTSSAPARGWQSWA